MAAADATKGERPGILSVFFLHPDLGIGGAERLIVDAALALRARGCRVQIWTPRYDPARCFSETRHLEVRTAGSWLPRSILGKGHALCAALRMIFLALHVLLLSGEEFDVFVCDQVRLTRRNEPGGIACGWPGQNLAGKSFL